MADSNSEPALFKGTSSEDCEIFVAMIRRRALEQGKQRDTEWMAIFASSYLIGDALYWYEGLDEDVQNDWTRLRPALLARFGRSGPPLSATSSTPVFPASASHMAIPTPAAAPPVSLLTFFSEQPLTLRALKDHRYSLNRQKWALKSAKCRWGASRLCGKIGRHSWPLQNFVHNPG
ncbi:hypothetical protein FRC00_007653 [Tulasnella sp. 408]|nr:hypothetical protein FRC00_007653 [Tulasnella sp. 408]